MFEIRISPETPTELKAVLQLVQTLAGMKPGPGLADARAKTSSAPVPEPPASTAEDAADAEEIVTIDGPSPPSGKPDPAYSAQQVLEALAGLRPGERRGGAEEGPGPVRRAPGLGHQARALRGGDDDRAGRAGLMTTLRLPPCRARRLDRAPLDELPRLGAARGRHRGAGQHLRRGGRGRAHAGRDLPRRRGRCAGADRTEGQRLRRRGRDGRRCPGLPGRRARGTGTGRPAVGRAALQPRSAAPAGRDVRHGGRGDLQAEHCAGWSFSTSSTARACRSRPWATRRRATTGWAPAWRSPIAR